MAAEGGILYGIETLVEGAVAAAKGIYDPTLPLKATLTPIDDVSLPRTHHSVAIVKGRAYLFGGKTSKDGGAETLADNDMHIVILPSSGIESTDYTKIASGPNSPPPRFGHAAAVIDDQIYIYGGSSSLDKSSAHDEPGTVWSFDTRRNQWSKLSPASPDQAPQPRSFHAMTATDQPRSMSKPTDKDTAPQIPLDPTRADILPEPEAADTYGTLIIHGGSPASSSSGEPLGDIQTFDIASRTWAPFSSPPSPPTISSSSSQTMTSSLAILRSRLYLTQGSQTHYLDLSKGSFSDKGGTGDLGLTPLGPWTSATPDLPSSSSSSLKSSNGSNSNDASSSALIPITTGQGRNYLLNIKSQAAQSDPSIFALQLPPEASTAAAWKDKARTAISKATNEHVWAEVRYYGPNGVLVQEGQVGRGIGRRDGFACAKGTEIDGASVLVWGGRGGERGAIRGDGIMISVDI